MSGLRLMKNVPGLFLVFLLGCASVSLAQDSASDSGSQSKLDATRGKALRRISQKTEMIRTGSGDNFALAYLMQNLEVSENNAAIISLWLATNYSHAEAASVEEGVEMMCESFGTTKIANIEEALEALQQQAVEALHTLEKTVPIGSKYAVYGVKLVDAPIALGDVAYSRLVKWLDDEVKKQWPDKRTERYVSLDQLLDGKVCDSIPEDQRLNNLESRIASIRRLPLDVQPLEKSRWDISLATRFGVYISALGQTVASRAVLAKVIGLSEDDPQTTHTHEVLTKYGAQITADISKKVSETVCSQPMEGISASASLAQYRQLDDIRDTEYRRFYNRYITDPTISDDMRQSVLDKLEKMGRSIPVIKTENGADPSRLLSAACQRAEKVVSLTPR